MSVPHISLALVTGSMLGAVYMTTLWLTVRALPSSARPSALLFCSMMVRLGLLLAGFYWITGGEGDALLACLLSFLILRFAATRWVTAGVKRSITS